MGNTLREAFFSHEMEEKKTNNMTKEEKTAFEWALNQKFTSVAARYARILARYILKTEDAEIKSLRHYRDTTAGLWATDKPEKVKDPEKMLFRLEDK
jgi:hypothetical protein